MARKWKTNNGELDLNDRGVVMGILNCTPDSFASEGPIGSTEEWLRLALQMIEQGVGIIDIGGESTRPGSEGVSVEMELERVLPVIRAIREQWNGMLSIDTSKPEVAEAAIGAGVNIVNDVSGFRNPEMVLLCRDAGVGMVCMHMQGEPSAMQNAPEYEDVVCEVREFFQASYERLTIAGIAKEAICFDPGIGFGKTVEHNLAILRNLNTLPYEGCPLLVGLSKKSFIGALLEHDTLLLRGAATHALTGYCRSQGVMLHRVHDVGGNVSALRMTEALI